MDYISASVAIIALIISGLSLWYGYLKKVDPVFCCSRWTALGIENSGKDGSTFIVKVDINNPSNKPVIIKDIVLIATTKNKSKIIYEPIMLWDLTYYIESMGVPKKIVEFQKGQIPLPIVIPAKQSFGFKHEILFMPQDKKTSIINNTDAPFEIEIFALTDLWRNYKKVAYQNFDESNVENLKNGNFSGVLSTASTENRKKLLTIK